MYPRNAPPAKLEKLVCKRLAQRKRGLLSRCPYRGALDVAVDEGFVLAEIGLEPAAQAARHLVIGAAVRPGAARVEHVARDLGTALGHQEAEIRVLTHRHPREAAV